MDASLLDFVGEFESDGQRLEISFITKKTVIRLPFMTNRVTYIVCWVSLAEVATCNRIGPYFQGYFIIYAITSSTQHCHNSKLRE